MGVQFFNNWELWEKLTFVLAAGIVAVFFIGWIKLWWMQRRLKKHSLLDEEKRVRQMEMRKTGLPVGRRLDIPFGVRAIQSGIEVEGIWISRPTTPMETRSPANASSTNLNLLDIDAEPRPVDKGKGVMGSAMRPPATVTDAEPTPESSLRTSPIGSSFDQGTRLNGGGPSSSGPSSSGPSSYSLQRPPNDNTRAAPYSSTTTQVEGATARYRIETYIPTSSPSTPTPTSSLSPRLRPAADRLSVSSEEGLSISSPRYPAEIRSRPYHSPFEDSESSSSAGPSGTQGKYCSRVRAETRGDPFETPEIDRTASPSPQSAHRPSLAATRPIPVRTYSEQRENTSSRVVNAGFEVLPAGTFSRHDSQNSPGTAR